MSHFDTACAALFDIEGGYTNDPNDRGGKTKYGVTELVARAAGYSGRMEELSVYAAKQIAKQRYWDSMHLDEISTIAYPVGAELFDTGYLCGTGTAARFFQRSLNVFNRQAADYHDVTVDGAIGMLTVHAFRLFMVKRGIAGQNVMLKALNSLQGEYHVAISENRPTNENNVFGWFANRVAIGKGA